MEELKELTEIEILELGETDDEANNFEADVEDTEEVEDNA